MPGQPGPQGTQTVAQIFQSQRLVQWWQTPTQRFGQGSGAGVEQGTDFGVPLNTPIGSPVTGKVLVSNYSGDPSLGYIVQIAAPNGSIWHFQHLNTSSLTPNQTVAVGQVIGNSGGPPGTYSTGPHIEVRYAPNYNPALANGSGLGAAYWSDGKWVDPLGKILATTGGTASSQGIPGQGVPGNPLTAISGLFSGLFGFASTSTAVLPTGASFTLPPVQIAPTADVTNFLVALDTTLEIVNPFDVLNAQQDTILGATFTDPISWIEGFGYNMVADMAAFVWRLIFIALGAYICFKVINHFINFQQLASNAIKLGTKGAMLAA